MSNEASGPFDTENTDLEAIASLLLGDVEQIKAGRKGKGREGVPPADAEIAFDLLAEELKTLLSVVEDQHVALSIATAVDTDRALLLELARVDGLILEDRICAVRVERGEILTPLSSPPCASSVSRGEAGDEASSPSASSLSTPTTTSASDILESSRWFPASDAQPTSGICAVCGDPIKESGIKFPCEHMYHVDCAVQLFRESIKDESLWPPRCCRQPIPPELVVPYLSSSSAVLFNEKTRERATADRLYCPVPSCSQFIGPASKNQDSVICSKCSTAVCTACKALEHPSHIPCNTDSEAQQFLALAEDEGWKRCPGCHQVVELALGCYHMTCRCRKEFCYLCTATWKTCLCDQWDEGRLTAAAELRVDHQLADGHIARGAEQPRQQLVFQAAEALRFDHECDHTGWRYQSGGAQCESCFKYLPRYILCCKTCQMLACVRCQRNRL